MDDTQAAREAIMLAVDAYDAARLAHHGQSIALGGMSETNKRSIAPMIQAAIDAYFAASSSIPAAAALLRAEGWTVTPPACGTCGGSQTVVTPYDVSGVSGGRVITCPTCNGTSARL